MPKTYTNPVKIDGKDVGTYTFVGPATTAEIGQYGGTIKVDYTLVTGVKGTDTFEGLDAYIYGAKLKAGAPVRIAAEAGVVKDHKVTNGKNVTDLDTLPLDKACKLVSGLRAAMAQGLDIGPKNAVKVEHFAQALLDAGKVIVGPIDGSLVPTPEPTAAPAVKANGKR